MSTRRVRQISMTPEHMVEVTAPLTQRPAQLPVVLGSAGGLARRVQSAITGAVIATHGLDIQTRHIMPIMADAILEELGLS